MGLFGNRSDDDYISPFDVDKSPDYIDPSTAIEREAKRGAKRQRQEERRRKARKRAEHHRQERIEQAYYHGARQTAVPPASAAGPQPSRGRRQPDALRRPTANPASDAARKPGSGRSVAVPIVVAVIAMTVGALIGNVLGSLVVIGAIVYVIHVARTRRGGRARDASGSGPVIAVVVLVVAAIIIAGAVVFGVGIARRSASTGPSRGSFSLPWDDPDDDYVEREPETLERAGTLIDDYDDGRLAITIARAYAGVPDDHGSRTVVVEVEASNEGSAATSLSSIGDLEVFQNGVELQDSYLYPDDDDVLPGYDSMSSINDIAPGAETTVTMAFALRDDVTPLDVRISDHADITTIRSAFTIGEDAPNAPFTQIDSSELPAIPTPTDTAGMTTVDEWDGTDLADVRIDDISRGPQTHDGQNTVIVTYRWINRSDEPMRFSWIGDATASLNGTELEKVYYFEDPPAGYVQDSVYLSVLPDAEATVTIAYEMPRASGTVNARIADYDDTVLVERSMKLD